MKCTKETMDYIAQCIGMSCVLIVVTALTSVVVLAVVNLWRQTL